MSFTEHDNATWFFLTPRSEHHNSESFWSTLFALYLLAESRGNRDLALPAFRYVEADHRWAFQPAGTLAVPTGLEFTDVVVEGKIRPHFLPRVGPVPDELLDLRPDILFHHQDRVIVIEVKTVGHELGQYQRDCYLTLTKFLRSVGYTTELYFLISAGHEKRRDLGLLRWDPAGPDPFKILLWEQVFRQMCEAQPSSPLSVCLGNISAYYANEAHFMHGEC